MHKKKGRLKRLLLCLCAALALYIAGTAVGIWRYAGMDETRPADAVIILGAGTSGSEVSPVFRERIRHGVWLYRSGYAGKLILTGGYGEGSTRSDAYIAMQYALSLGVPEEDILIEERSTITQENLANAKAIMDENSLRTALLVSDPLHMKRAMLLARDCGVEAYSSPTPTTRYVSLNTKLPFLAREVFFYLGYQVYQIWQ